MDKIRKNIVSGILVGSLLTISFLALATEDFSDGAFKKSLDGLKQDREAFRTARDQAKTDKKVAAKANHLDKMKRVLTRLVEVTVKHTERTKDRLSNMKFLDETLKTQALTELDAVIAKYNGYKTKITAATTIEELKTLAQEIKDYRKNTEEGTVKKIVALNLISKTENHILKKVEERITKVEGKIGELKAAGKDVTGLENHLALAKTAFQNIKTRIAEAKNTALTIKTQEDFKKFHDLVKGINDAVKEVYKHIKEVYKLAHEMVEGMETHETTTPSPTPVTTPVTP